MVIEEDNVVIDRLDFLSAYVLLLVFINGFDRSTHDQVVENLGSILN